jgi:hypothetical protein
VGAPLSAICDRGATAEDAVDGVITSRITACTTDGTNNKVANRGLRGCDLNTAVPGVYNISFIVYNSGGLASEQLNRTVTVTVTCPQGEFVCNNKVDCSVEGACLADLAGVSIVEEEVKTLALALLNLSPEILLSNELAEVPS